MKPHLPIVLAALFSVCGCAAPLQRFAYERPKMGTTFRIVLYDSEPGRAERAASAAFAEIDRLNGIYSDYDPASELSSLSALPAGSAQDVSAELAEVLAAAQRVAEESGGAFDVTVGPLVRLWRRARRQGELPRPERIAAARARVGYGLLAVDPRRGGGARATLAVDGMRLDLGGIAKGRTLDAVLDTLAAHGIERALVDGGGDVAASGPPPGRAGWRVVVSPRGAAGPRAAIELAGAAVATSGDANRFVEIDGVRYSHIVDPRTGLALTGGRAATVLAPTGLEADALASAACVLEPGAALELVLARGCEAYLLHGANEWRTPGMEARFLH
ncbi:MAG: FAD:protein FMN transferase [bacterium]|nr:FAD:protein FMN transferase [bacterium]